MSTRVVDLTPEVPGATVLRLAHYLVRNYTDWGALERADGVGEACLAFYRAAARWTGPGCFGRYALRCMAGAVHELWRIEARQHKDFPVNATAAAPHTKARYKRRGSRREHNRTYYYQHYESHARRDYQRHVARLGARALPYEEWRERRERKRRGMAA